MKKQQRSVDYDGLDGILQLPDTAIDEPKWYQTSWLYALIAAGLIGAFLLHNQNQPASPHSLPIQTYSALPSLAPKHSPALESRGSASKNIEQNTDTPQTDAPPAQQDSTVSAENTPEPQTLNLEPSTASPKIEAPAATSSGILFTVHFKFDSSKLNLLGKSEKDALIDAAKNCSNIIKLTGHTCNFGPAVVNKQIGLARANSVKKLLSANGIPDQKITIASAGMDSPAVANDSPSAAAKNRRVELTCQDR